MGAAGRDNRRVSLVIDYAGAQAMLATALEQAQQTTPQSGA